MQRGGSTSTVRRAVPDSVLDLCAGSADILMREQEQVALTLMVSFPLKVFDEFGERPA